MIKVTSGQWSALISSWNTVRCLPLLYNGDPDKEATSPLMWLDGSLSSQAVEAIVESPIPKPQERLLINVLTEISFTSAGKLISLSSMAGKYRAPFAHRSLHMF